MASLKIWNPDTSTWQYIGLGGGAFSDAPSDGKYYVRKDGAWVEASSGDGTTTVTLAADVVTDGTSNLQDVTGLSFAVAAGSTYFWEAKLFLEAASASTGCGLTANGPAITSLMWAARTHVTTGAETIRAGSTWDVNWNSAAAPGTARTAEIFGFLIPSADGTVILRFKSENNNTVTAKAGSFLKWRKVT